MHDNLAKLFSVLYYSYTVWDEEEFLSLWKMSTQFSKQSNKYSQSKKDEFLVSLEQELRTHKVWNNYQPWVSLAQNNIFDTNTKQGLATMFSLVNKDTVSSTTLTKVFDQLKLTDEMKQFSQTFVSELQAIEADRQRQRAEQEAREVAMRNMQKHNRAMQQQQPQQQSVSSALAKGLN